MEIADIPVADQHRLLLAMVDLTNDGVLALQAVRAADGSIADWRVLLMNTAFGRLADCVSTGSAGQSVRVAVPAWDALQFEAACRKALANASRHLFEASIGTPQGLRVLACGVGALGEHVCALRISDVTEDRRRTTAMQASRHALRVANEQLREANEQAGAASRAKSAFLATMSHEIRTPMTGVIGMADLLEYSVLDREQARMVATIRDSARALLGVMDGLLDFSKVEAGKLDLESAPLLPPAILAAACDTLAPLARQLGVSVRTEVDLTARTSVLGDPVRLRQIVTNLLSNAIKFSGNGGQPGHVTAQLQRADGVLRISVLDDGIGMDATTQARLFEPFMQAEASTTRRFGGTGLGLAITRRLVELMGGTIAVDSAPGTGARFTVQLPLADAAADAAGAPSAGCAPAAAAASGVADGASTTRGHVLVAEDDPINQQLIERQLEVLHLTCEIQPDGQQALEAWARGGHDLVLTDLHMPVMDGLALARAIRTHELARRLPRTPIVMLTANAVRGEDRRALDAGVDQYLTKPAQLAQLRDTLAGWLTRPPRAAGETPAPPAEAPAPTFSLAVLHALVGDDHDTVCSILDDYVVSAGEQATRLRETLTAGELRAAGAIAHKLKSASRSVGALALGDFCAELERLHERGGAAAVDRTLQRFEALLADALAAVRAAAKVDR